MVGYWCRVWVTGIDSLTSSALSPFGISGEQCSAFFCCPAQRPFTPRLLAVFHPCIARIGRCSSGSAGRVSSPLVRSRLRALFTTGLFVCLFEANACLSCLVLDRSLQLGSWACCQMPPSVRHTITSMALGLYPKPCPSFGSLPKPCNISNHLGFGPRCLSGMFSTLFLRR